MQVNQTLSILFYLKRSKANKSGMTAIYVRVTIDGLHAEISLGCKVLPCHWDNTNKKLISDDPNAKMINKKIGQTKTDIERHFDLVHAKQMIATPKLVLDSYKSPVKGEKLRQDRIQSLTLSNRLDEIIAEYIDYGNRYENAYETQPDANSLKMEVLAIEKKRICRKIEEFRKATQRFFWDNTSEKTLLLALNEYLLDFLLLCSTGSRSFHTLEKLSCRKRKYLEYIEYEYKGSDISLQELDHSFLKNLYHFLMSKGCVVHNTATKYLQIIKGIINRAVSLKWIDANPFFLYKCTYHDVHHDWLDMRQFESLLKHEFEDKKLNVIRDIFVFASFTGFAYNELYTLKQNDIAYGENGKLWVIKNRKKTGGDESVPLLPIPIQLLEKYKNYPACQVSQKLLPVPTVVEFNRCLKLIAAELDMKINLRTHKARFFFANEIAYNNGVPLKTVSRLLGQKSVKTTEVYVKANKRNISENMNMVEQKLFDAAGNLRTGAVKTESGAKIINIRLLDRD
jgi:integrase